MNYYVAPDGARIAYQEVGSGRPLVLLHGLMADSEFFGFQASLADQFRLIAIDLRGHGMSASAEAGSSIQQLADDVAGVAGQLEIGNAVIVGWSLGASVSWRVLSGAASRRFAGSVIIDMIPKVLNDGEWTLGLSKEVCDGRSSAMREDFQTFARAAGHAMFAQPLSAETQKLADWSADKFAQNDPVSVTHIWSSLVAEDLRPVLGEIRQPTLIAHGVHSQLYGQATADYLAAGLSSARVISFERSGHAPHLEEPDLFNTNIREFSDGLAPVRELQKTL